MACGGGASPLRPFRGPRTRTDSRASGSTARRAPGKPWLNGFPPNFAPHPSSHAIRVRHARADRPRPCCWRSLALVFVLGVGWILHGQRQTKAAHAALEELEAHAAQLARLDALLLQVLEAESGARAYVMSGDEHYLSRLHRRPRRSAGDTLAALHAGFAADPAARAAVDAARRPGGTALALARPTRRRARQRQRRGRHPDRAARRSPPTSARASRRLRAPLRTRMEGITRASFERSGQARGINSVLGVAIIALLLVIGGLAWRQEELRGRITALLRTENARLQAEVDARTAELTSLAGYLSETREAEHARLAAELHDEFGPLLSAVRMDAVWITRKLPAEALEPVRGRFDHLLDTLGRVVSSQAPHRRRPQAAAARRPRARRGLRSLIGRDAGPSRARRSCSSSPRRCRRLRSRWRWRSTASPRRRSTTPAATPARSASRSRSPTAGEEIMIGVTDDGAGFDPAQVRAKGHGLAGLAAARAPARWPPRDRQRARARDADRGAGAAAARRLRPPAAAPGDQRRAACACTKSSSSSIWKDLSKKCSTPQAWQRARTVPWP